MSAITPTIGSANSLADVLAALNTALTSNGYTYNGTNKTFVKGSCVAAVQLEFSGTAQVMKITGGTGVDGAGALVNPTPSSPRLRAGIMGPAKTLNIAWPAEYRIFIYTNPDMWIVALKHDVSYWQFMMCGVAINHGHTGNAGDLPFIHATYSEYNIDARIVNNANISTGTEQGPGQCPNNMAIPFFGRSSGNDNTRLNAFVYVNEPAGFFGDTSPIMKWSPYDTGGSDDSGQQFQSNWFNNTILSPRWSIGRLPNAWNNDSQLIPLTVQAHRPAGFWSQGFEIPHLRLMRNDFYNDGDIITLGSDKWMTLPCRKKNAVNRNAIELNANLDDSGTYAYAIEYVAP